MAGTAFIIRVASAAVVFVSQILLARWMGSFEYGNYVYVWTWLLLVGDIVHLGLPLTAQRHIPEYIQRNSLDLLRGYLIASRWLTFGLATAAAIVGAAMVHAVEAFARPACGHAALSRLRGAAVLRPLLHARWRGALVRLDCAGVDAAFAVASDPHSRADRRRLRLGLPLDATTTMLATAIAIWVTALGQLLVLNRRLAKSVAAGTDRTTSRAGSRYRCR